MNPRVNSNSFTIDRALQDKQLLGAALGDFAPWKKTWGPATGVAVAAR